jgi:uncharacterized protein (DUF1499 family)
MTTRAGSTPGSSDHDAKASAHESSHPSRVRLIKTSLQYPAALTLALFSFVAAGLALVLLSAPGLLYRLGLLSIPSAFGVVRWGVYLGLAAVALSVLTAIRAYRQGERVKAAGAGACVLLLLVAVSIPLRWLAASRSAPPIHDVTTDLENPPTFVAVVPLRADAPNSLERSPRLAEQQRAAYPDLAPITLPNAVADTFDRALAAAQEMGWVIVTADKSAGLIEATDVSRWFGFEEDVVVRLTPWGSGTRVDVRSASRVGANDMGTNARRIREYLAMLQN